MSRSLTIENIQSCLSAHTPTPVSHANGKRAAVLVPIIKKRKSLHLLFTKRTDTVEHHKGQISFPGGAYDKSDTSFISTALRETEEEVGLPQTAVKILGALSDIVIPTGFIVTPIVGFIEKLPELTTNSAEVAEIIIVPLEDFFKKKNFGKEMRFLKGEDREIFVYHVWKEPIWGATAFIVKQFTDVLEQ